MAPNNYFASHDQVRGFGAVLAAFLLWMILHVIHTVSRMFHLFDRRTTTTTTANDNAVGTTTRNAGWHDNSYDGRDAARDLFLWLFFLAWLNNEGNNIDYTPMWLLWVVFVLGLIWILLRTFLRRWADFFSWVLIPFMLALVAVALHNRHYVANVVRNTQVVASS